MPDQTGLLPQVYVQLDGQLAPPELVQDLLEVTVENSLHLPDVATLTINDPMLRWVDNDHLAPGKSIKISTKVEQSEHPIFDGEVVELEPQYIPGKQRLVVRAFDRLHRLARGRHVRSFQNVTDSDIVGQIVGELHMAAHTGVTSQVHDYVLQDNETNLEFLRDRAVALGFLLYVEGKVLHFDAPKDENAALELRWGDTISEFHPRLTTVGQVNKATVRGWDPATRKEIVGRATSGNGAPRTPGSSTGAAVAYDAFGDAEALVTDRVPRTQAEADRVAQAVMDRAASDFIVAEGACRGNPSLKAGTSVRLSGLGTRFDGTYFVTGSTHTLGHEDGYSTHFFVSGHRPSTLLGILRADGTGEDARVPGLVVGIVTDNQDKGGLGRVKVRYPNLSDNNASDWARLVAVGAGPGRGVEFVPEVNDEVLVGFEQGDVHHPYILGGLWNGQDAPPKKSTDIVDSSSGAVKQRIIRSRLGHTITLDDSDDAPSITIVDKTGNNTIKIDSKTNNMNVAIDGDLSIKAKGAVKIEGQTIDLEATTDLKLKGMSADVEAQNALSLKGLTADLKAQTTATVSGSVSVSIN